jgi:hypothetical protein
MASLKNRQQPCSPCRPGCTRLGYNYKIVSVNPNTFGTADVTFTYLDFACAPCCFKLPVYTNAPTGWAGKVTAKACNTWTVTRVPYDSVAKMAMRPCVNACNAVRIINVVVPGSPCASVPLNVVWNVDAIGGTSLSFTWSTPEPSAFTSGFVYELINVNNGLVVHSGVFSANTRSHEFLQLEPETGYVLILTGICGSGGAGTPTTTFGETNPPARLGLNYSILNVVNAPTTCYIIFTYTDYYCATNIQDPVFANPPDLWQGGITRLSTNPYTWGVTQVPYDYPMLLIMQADSDASCLNVAYPDDPLVATLTITTPSAPANVCSDVPLTGLALRLATSTCCTFVWNAQPLFGLGYSYTLLQGSTQITSGTIPNFDTTTLQLKNLNPHTAYTFQLSGNCIGGGVGSIHTLMAITSAACSPQLAPFVYSSTNPANPGFVAPGNGTYTANLTYSGSLCVSGLELVWIGPASQGHIAVSGTNTWQVSGLAPATTYNLQFTATPSSNPECTNCCVVTNPTPITTPVTFKTPGPSNQCVNQQLIVQWNENQSCSTYLNFSWTASAISQFASFIYTVKNPATGVTIGPLTLPGSTSTYTVTNLTPNTQYYFTLTGVCANGSKTTTQYILGVTNPVSTPTLAPYPADNSSFSYGATPASTTLTLNYGTNLQTCVKNLVLAFVGTPPVGSVITPPATGLWAWNVSNLTQGQTYNFTMSADADTSTCTCSPGTVAPINIAVTVPDQPTPTPNSAPFGLAITHYSGPPNRIQSFKIKGTTLADSILRGSGTSDGSYSQQVTLNKNYATIIVQGFVKYHMQKLITNKDIKAVGESPFYLPITTIYYGNAADPTVQGSSKPQMVGVYPSSVLAYNYADNSVGAYFINPPMLEFYKQQMIYNWEAQQTNIYENHAQVQLASNNYGSKDYGQQWWFNCTIDPATGKINTTDPIDPIASPSLVDGLQFDGSMYKNTPLDPLTAGWNCMERWFMHTAYCNQQLRQMINDGLIQGSASSPMTLNDLTSDNAKYFQISAITTDNEGNGFPNTWYPTADPRSGSSVAWQTWFPTVTSAQCNYTINALWNKWINQTTTAPVGYPTWWISSAAANLTAPQPRIFMPATTFTLPCALSTTTPSLIKDMGVSDLGSADFSSVSNIFHEIYDTSNSAPFYYLQPSVAPKTDCVPGGGSITGVPFTDDIRKIADSTDPANTYSQYPEKYLAQYGTWDNLVLPATTCSGALVENSDGSAVVPSTNPALPGSYTAYNNSLQAFSPLMNTSKFNPWNTSSQTNWILEHEVGSSQPTSNTSAMGYALESSRYDLYNGAWAYESNNDLGSVKQDYNSADGAKLWYDLSTGLKPYAASIMKSVQTPACAAGQVWMLSNQCGPFVNNKGVQFSDRTANVPVTDPSKLLTFTCPGDPGWPGWKGMAGQRYAPGTPGVLNAWALDQVSLGSLDPSNGVIPETKCTENNFGVFADFNVQVAAWLAMAQDLQGLGACSAGLTQSGGIKYTAGTPTGVPLCGCYELAFLPASWLGPYTFPS